MRLVSARHQPVHEILVVLGQKMDDIPRCLCFPDIGRQQRIQILKLIELFHGELPTVIRIASLRLELHPFGDFGEIRKVIDLEISAATIGHHKALVTDPVNAGLDVPLEVDIEFLDARGYPARDQIGPREGLDP